MSRTYKAVGINLKGMALGESDRLLTILTPEFGLVRAVAPGARKHNSSLSGRSGLFVVNELLIAKGRSLDKITQAETIESYPGLSQDLGKLAASQYISEIVLCQALSEQPQAELFSLLNEHLSRLEQLPKSNLTLVLAHLAHAVFHLLALSGITPEVQACCLTREILTPDFSTPQWQVGFSVPAGGIINLAAWEQLQAQSKSNKTSIATYSVQPSKNTIPKIGSVAEPTSTSYQTIIHQQQIPTLNLRINASELALLQQLAASELPTLTDECLPNQPESLKTNWEVIEEILRQYAQYHLGRPIRSAALIDSYLASSVSY